MIVLSYVSRNIRRLTPSWVAPWLRDTRLLLASQLLVVLTTTALAIILARSLGPSEWGFFSALLGLSLALSIFVNLGLGTWLLRELSQLQVQEAVLTKRQREGSRRIVGGVLVNFAFGCLLFVSAAVVLVFVGPELGTVIALLSLITYTVFVSASSCLEAYLRAERTLKTVVAATLLERGLLLALAGVAVFLTSGIWAIGVAYLAAGLARLSFVCFTIFVKQGLPVVMPAIRHIRGFVLKGIPFAFNTVALNVIPRLDTLIVASVSVSAAGYFALGDRIMGPAIIVPVVASTALYPFLAREDRSSRSAWKISGGMMVLGLAAAVIGAIAAPIVIPPVFGESYRDAVPTVQVMFFVLPFLYSSNPLLAQLYSSGEERKVFGATLISSVLGTAAIVVGAVVIGAAGAAVGYVVRHVLFTAVLSGIAISRRGEHGAHEVREASGGWLMSDPTPRD
jgi:O-antigen/teichoic acid export membrane protein